MRPGIHMLQSISTKYLPQTNHKPARIKATATSGYSLTLSRSMHVDRVEDDHIRVAHALAERLKWRGPWHGGTTKVGFVFVIAMSQPAFNIEES